MINIEVITDETARVEPEEQLADVQVENSNRVVKEPSVLPRIAYVNLLADKWVGDASPYSQVVVVDGATENSQVDLTPSADQLAVFYEKDLAFVTENEDGVVTVYAIGQKPAHDYSIQATITEVQA